MLTTYDLDGTKTEFQFNWPYLDRSHIMVTVDLAARPFKFIDDHRISVKSIFGEPLPEGKLKIFRVTPDLDAFADFKDASKLTAYDLNRARLQCLYLIQERSGGLGGSVGQAVQLLVNEIETISGALDTLAVSQGVLTAGLQTLKDLSTKIEKVGNEGVALRDLIDKTIKDSTDTALALNKRVDAVESKQNNLQASVSQSINTLITNDLVQASRVDSLTAKVDALSDDDASEALSAVLTQAAVVSVKNGVALGKRIETLEVKVGDDIQAMIQKEQQARASADEAFAQQITTLQAAVDGDLATLKEDMKVTADKVGNLNAQWSMKAQVKRADGSPVFAGIGLSATANNDLAKSEIVMQADRLVFVAADKIDAPPKPIFTAGMVDGSPTLVIPSNTMGDRTYPGRILVDGSIEARSIAADSITGDKIKAGAITAREIDVNLGVNLCPNSEFADQRSDGLAAYWNYGGSASASNWGNFGMNLDASWTVAGGRTMYFRNSSTNGDMNIDSAYVVFVSDPISVVPGERYEFSVYAGAHRCKAQVYLQWFDASGTYVGNSTPSLPETTNDRAASGGKLLSGYLRIGSFAKLPLNAATAQLVIRKGLHTAAEGSDSYLFFTKPMVAVAKPNQTRLSPYNVSGLGTKITPGGITTPSLSALSANIGLLRTAASGARVEIESNQIRVYDGNNVLRVRMGVW